MRRRGDNIPPVSAYAHWNEEAESMWYAENKYDMEHADEVIEDDDDERENDDPFQANFATQPEARAFIAKWQIDLDRDTLSEYGGKWCVEHYDKKANESYRRQRWTP